MLRGPRQVGKTTAQFQIISDVLGEGVPARNVLRVQFDELASLRGIKEPILAIADWFERNVTTARFNALAHAGRKAYLFFDEVQNLDGWDAQLKSLVDHAALKVVVTGSSALRIELGRDSLAGRVSTVEAGVALAHGDRRAARPCRLLHRSSPTTDSAPSSTRTSGCNCARTGKRTHRSETRCSVTSRSAEAIRSSTGRLLPPGPCLPTS